jgi:hypothetical protein
VSARGSRPGAVLWIGAFLLVPVVLIAVKARKRAAKA